MPGRFYSAGISFSAATSGTPIFTITTGANLRAYIVEIGGSWSANTLSFAGLARPNNTPVASASSLGQAEDPQSPASSVNVDTAWSTAPTIASPAPYVRRWQTIGAIVAGWSWVWVWHEDAPLVIPVNSSVVAWNFGASTNAAGTGYVRWFEDV